MSFPQDVTKVNDVDQNAFCFLELPSELRNQIYDLIIVPGTVKIKPMVRRTTQQPPLTQICAQIRSETLPLYYELKTFVMAFDFDLERTASLAGRDIATEITAWAARVGANQLKHLRRLDIDIEFNTKYRTLYRDFEFRFSPESGMTFDTMWSHKFPQYQMFLDDHELKMETLRKLTGQQGGAIITAILARPQMWDFNVLMQGHTPKL